MYFFFNNRDKEIVNIKNKLKFNILKKIKLLKFLF